MVLITDGDGLTFHEKRPVFGCQKKCWKWQQVYQKKKKKNHQVYLKKTTHFWCNKNGWNYLQLNYPPMWLRTAIRRFAASLAVITTPPSSPPRDVKDGYFYNKCQTNLYSLLSWFRLKVCTLFVYFLCALRQQGEEALAVESCIIMSWINCWDSRWQGASWAANLTHGFTYAIHWVGRTFA